ncbi:MAG TPA: phage virion morphogenesis protein [Sphingomonas sp.]|jgi:phage virion morphogenesis protein|uniref:phage virion morphogenesis protein n=1 Tax=Sphingomonas sp. TaxID=28214 RepID=UPI002ED83584
MSDGLDQLEDLAGALLRGVAPAERRTLLRTVAREIAKSQRTRIAAQIQPDGTPFAPRKAKDQPKGRLRRKGRIKRAAMFRRLRLAKHLQAGATDREAWIGFSGEAARVARIHQEGREDAPAKGQAKVRYAKREILGLTDTERKIMLDAVLASMPA